jgi:hypothetical protein
MAQPSRLTSACVKASLARGHADHLLDQVQPGDQLGHRVLHLQAGVHLQKVEVLVLADHELRARAGT